MSLIIGLALGANYQLTSTNDNYLSLVAGFTARMQCSIYRCTLEKPVVSNTVYCNQVDYVFVLDIMVQGRVTTL